MPATESTAILFQSANVKLTATRLDIGLESFQIKKITAINIETEARHTRTGLSLVVVGVAALLGGLLANLPVLIMAGAAGAVGGGMMCVAKVNRTIILTIRGQNVRALTSKDGKLVADLVGAIRGAMESRT